VGGLLNFTGHVHDTLLSPMGAPYAGTGTEPCSASNACPLPLRMQVELYLHTVSSQVPLRRSDDRRIQSSPPSYAARINSSQV
jgi:hypothetical protein